ncbi:hypothetical protein H7I87_02980 [Mycobacterium timonense]|nr:MULTISPECIES: hypothetical protein [Mycobacterium avium complex (MAC)]MCV6991873.1 hypothetical protein [Mycobacterium bouchedurhonense]MCV6993694.1 hypothetical protein [Mycobacterium timonense]
MSAASNNDTTAAGHGERGWVPLQVRRDGPAFERWWADDGDIQAITELVADLSHPFEIEHTLHALANQVFHTDPTPVPWLTVAGLRPGVGVDWISLDIEPAHGGDGVVDGVEVVLWLQPAGCSPAVSLLVSTYVSKPHRVFAPEPATSARETLAWVIDTATALVNTELADRDRFNAVARAPAVS